MASRWSVWITCCVTTEQPSRGEGEEERERVAETHL